MIRVISFALCIFMTVLFFITHFTVKFKIFKRDFFACSQDFKKNQNIFSNVAWSWLPWKFFMGAGRPSYPHIRPLEFQGQILAGEISSPSQGFKNKRKIFWNVAHSRLSCQFFFKHFEFFFCQVFFPPGLWYGNGPQLLVGGKRERRRGTHTRKMFKVARPMPHLGL